MKRKFIALTGMIFVFSLVAGGVQAQVLQRGMRSEEIADIQEILKTDPKIYPEGLVTGYFGPLTQVAVRRLQVRCGIAQTGVIDSETRGCLFPINRAVKVLAPNGGEVWDRSEIQTIKWEVVFSPPGPGPAEETETRPFWDKASIDLFRRVTGLPGEPRAEEMPEIIRSVFVKHIATVNMFDLVYSWRIGSEIPNSDDYVIRITLGSNILPLYWTEKQPVEPLPSQGEIWGEQAEQAEFMPPYPWPVSWDESDSVFTIAGETCEKPDLKPVIALLEEAIKSLNAVLKLLYEMTR